MLRVDDHPPSDVPDTSSGELQAHPLEKPAVEADALVQSLREALTVSEAELRNVQAKLKSAMLATDLTARIRTLFDPEEVLYETARALGEYTGADRCLYIEIDDAADTLTIRRDFTRDGIASMAGTFPLSAFGTPIVENLRAGHITQISDTEADPRLNEENRATFRSTNFRAFVAAPLHQAGHFVAVLALHQAAPRDWTAEEADLLGVVIERTWLAFENARLFREMQRRVERETLLNEIGEAVRVADDPEAILAAAVSTLGKGLGVDRCYFVRYDQIRNTGRVFPEWLRRGAGLETMVGPTRPMSGYSVNRDSRFVAGRSSIVNDTMAFAPEEAAPLLALKVRALLRVPIAVGDQMTALGVAMAYEPRQWAEEDVRLVENVAALLRSALASANVQLRERNIARQLQSALQPVIPERIPGMALASHYRASLDEAEVGGDFYDTFDLGDGRFCLVVADLAGKGLNAASQVALVRNNLRYALYTAENDRPDTLAAAVEELNGVLVKHSLLMGFATVFVGVWNDADSTLTYVNAGQEPALVWRFATAVVEMMPPTGPVLGGFGEAGFSEETITLAAGDVWAAFSDGMTEIGTSRTRLLGIDGVIPRFARSCAASLSESTSFAEPSAILDSLIADVEAFAEGNEMRDDLCALVGVRR